MLSSAVIVGVLLNDIEDIEDSSPVVAGACSLLNDISARSDGWESKTHKCVFYTPESQFMAWARYLPHPTSSAIVLLGFLPNSCLVLRLARLASSWATIWSLPGALGDLRVSANQMLKIWESHSPFPWDMLEDWRLSVEVSNLTFGTKVEH